VHAEIHTAVAVQSHPDHQTCGGYFIAVEQAEEQPARHGVGGMAAAETI
jgi:hypothetical protein